MTRSTKKIGPVVGAVFVAWSLVAASARAQSTAGEQEHVDSTQPKVSIKGDSAGKAKLSLGATVTRPYARDSDVLLSAIFTNATSDGVSNVFTFGDSATKASDWGFDLELSFIRLEPFKNDAPTMLKAAEAAWDTCFAQCAPDARTDFCRIVNHKKYRAAAEAAEAAYNAALPAAMSEYDASTEKSFFDACGNVDPRVDPKQDRACSRMRELRGARDEALLIANQADQLAVEAVDGLRLEPNPGNMPPTKLCKEGAAIIDKAGQANRDKRAAVPLQMLSFAAHLGQTKHDFLAPGAMAGLLTAGSATDNSVGAAFVYMRSQLDSPVTYEAPLLISFHKEPAVKTAKWCVPAGMVTRPDGSGASDPAETCNERALGAPTPVTQLRGAFLLGLAKREDGSFRASGGPIASALVPDKGKFGFDLGLEFPLYVSTNLLPDDKGIFKGIVRFTPSVLRHRDLDGTIDTRFLFTIELFTGRSIFPTAANLL